MRSDADGAVRREAERLVATALAVGSQALRNIDAGHQVATGTAECCACPLCRALSAVRDPSPEFAGRLADAVGDVATGISGLLRTFAGGTNDHRSEAAEPAGGAEPEGDDECR